MYICFRTFCIFIENISHRHIHIYMRIYFHLLEESYTSNRRSRYRACTWLHLQPPIRNSRSRDDNENDGPGSSTFLLPRLHSQFFSPSILFLPAITLIPYRETSELRLYRLEIKASFFLRTRVEGHDEKPLAVLPTCIKGLAYNCTDSCW